GDTVFTDETTAFTVGDLLVNYADPDVSDTLVVTSIDTTGTVGLLTDNGDGTYTYDPNGQFSALTTGDTATDSFTYSVTDGHGSTATATVTITISGANRLPLAASDTASTDENTSITTGNVLANDSDPDADPLTVLSVDLTGTTGAVTNNGDGTFTYNPNGQFSHLAAGESTTDSFSYTVSDGAGGTATASVTVSVLGVNNSPVAVNDSITANEDTVVVTASVLANDSDVDTSDVLTVTTVDTTGTLGLVTNNGDGTFIYDPNGQFASLGTGASATDSFSYTVSDGKGGIATASVVVTITGGNDVPVALADTASVGEDLTVVTGNVLANDTDADGDALTVLSVNTTGTLGLVTNNLDGTFTYNPNGQFETLGAGATATDSFIYTVSDGGGRG
ncbi:MAG: tandem-95 repeat protein, partial [Pseudomonadales bacterium]|nr:tandem-95 repeat protein [Pseudomonadales bacterium]